MGYFWVYSVHFFWGYSNQASLKLAGHLYLCPDFIVYNKKKYGTFYFRSMFFIRSVTRRIRIKMPSVPWSSKFSKNFMFFFSKRPDIFSTVQTLDIPKGSLGIGKRFCETLKSFFRIFSMGPISNLLMANMKTL